MSGSQRCLKARDLRFGVAELPGEACTMVLCGSGVTVVAGRRHDTVFVEQRE
ncbi:hypothetical protein [Rhodococcus koreensis]|uniref:hypothetical protein n=1 Tax=Rhodococcus koreensis TaxID=99653 RepID=UPI0036702A97